MDRSRGGSGPISARNTTDLGEGRAVSGKKAVSKGEDLVVLALVGMRAVPHGLRSADSGGVASRSLSAGRRWSALLVPGALGGEGALELALAGDGGEDGQVDVEEHGDSFRAGFSRVPSRRWDDKTHGRQELRRRASEEE